MDGIIKNTRERLASLKKLDSKKSIFGARSHKYRLNKVLGDAEVALFENQHGILLPEDYREFLLHIGNGGAGPYYGLQTLESSLFSDLDRQEENEKIDPSGIFQFSEPWNLDYEGDPDDESAYEEFEKEYYDPKWDNGMLRICNYGCGISLNLVVNGDEYGNIWVDDRCNDGGFYPDPYFSQTTRSTFIQWYNLWLDASHSELSE